LINLYLITSWCTRRCPGWPMAKLDSKFFLLYNKKGDWIICGNVSQWNMRHVTYERLQHSRKRHTCARKRRQHREWVQCLALQLIQKKRHVTKLECYPLWEMSLYQNNDMWQLNVFEYGTTKFPEDINTAGSDTHTHTHTHTHTRARARLSGLASQCCHSVCETFPRNDKTGWEGWRRFHVNTWASDTHTHTHTHTHTRDSQGWQLCVVVPLAKHFDGTTEKVEKVKECVVRRQGKEEGRTKVR